MIARLLGARLLTVLRGEKARMSPGLRVGVKNIESSFISKEPVGMGS